MTTQAAADIAGLEYDWLACDADGHVALFSTAGAGAVPAGLLRSTNAHDAAIDALLVVPARTTARFAPVLPAGCVDTWRSAGERGVFAFDCDPNGGPYRLVAAPAVAVVLDELPGGVARVARAIVARGVRFTDLREGDAIASGTEDWDDAPAAMLAIRVPDE